MLLDYYYWFFTKALDKNICNKIIREADRLKKEKAITGFHGKYSNKKYKDLTEEQKKSLKNKRDSNIVWLNNSWIYDLLHPYVRTANTNAGWNFQWEKSEPIQFTQYKLNQFYDWHQDPFPKAADEGPFKGLVRKLSCVVTLTDSSEYSGGELEFDLRNLSEGTGNNIITCKEIMPRGSVVVFPSHIWHRVKPVNKGTRLSLVMWSNGKPFI
jgi:PKHD-type hydroxylase